MVVVEVVVEVEVGVVVGVEVEVGVGVGVEVVVNMARFVLTIHDDAIYDVDGQTPTGKRRYAALLDSVEKDAAGEPVEFHGWTWRPTEAEARADAEKFLDIMDRAGDNPVSIDQLPKTE